METEFQYSIQRPLLHILSQIKVITKVFCKSGALCVMP